MMSAMRAARGSVLCFVAVCSLLFAVVHARECTEDDWAWQYTACRAGTRALVYYKNPETDDCSGGVPQPENVFGLPCDIFCPAGTYLPPGELECKGCPPGMYSLSGGVRIQSWSAYPDGEVAPGVKFESWSAPLTSPDTHLTEGAWSVTNEGLLIRSGNITHNHMSVLQLRTHLVQDGSISFAFRVDCEPSYDGMEFVVDNVVVMNRTSGVYELKVVSFPLTRGFHTLAWRYTKDLSVSQGVDAAFLRFVEIDGVSYAADFCSPCPPGTASAAENASACAYCQRNYYSSESGSTECTACPSSQYAPVGSSSCYDRYECTADDYVPVYGACAFDAQSGKYMRPKTWKWIEGTKCNHASAHLPDDTTVECPSCNPGMYRNTNGQCVDCPVGTVSDGTDAACTPCAAGYESQPGIYIKNWYRAEELPVMATGCSGDCGTNGWILNGTAAHSGWGHGASVETYLEFNFTTQLRSIMRFSYTVNCYAWDCRLVVYDMEHSSLALFSGQYNDDYLELLPGPHTIRFVYTRNHGITENNYALIHEMVLYGSKTLDGTVGNGGGECVACDTGYYSGDSQGWCAKCPAGHSSNGLSTGCSACPENTYNDIEGGSCKTCGKNVHSDPGSTKCDDTCRFTDEQGYTYDLSKLKRDTMYGPIYDSTMGAFYINLCSRFNASASSSSAPCKNYYGNAIESFACHPYPDCPEGRRCGDYNIGNKLDMYPLEDGNGFNLTYSDGDYGCGGLSRNTTVTMMCKPGGGVGVPGPWPNRTIEGPDCHYDILWESVYGCPLCSEKDYTFVYGECKNGIRRKIYQWRTNPLACHDGVQLPPDEDVPSQCQGEVVCPLGHYYNEETTNCTPCEPGTYSPGAGYAYYRFDSIPERFTTACGSRGACTFFFTSNGKLRSGLGNSALVYTSQFFVDGFVNFTYSFISGDGVDSADATHFYVLLDGESVFGDLVDGKSFAASKKLSFPVTAGSHMITFEFDAFSSQSYVEFEEMFIYGDRYAPLYCPVCSDGYKQPNAAGEMCLRCSDNTVSDDSHQNCVPCESGKFTIDCTTCVPKEECTEDNFALLYTRCKGGKRTRMYVKLDPQAICEGGFSPSLEPEEVECDPCPDGMHRYEGSDECVGCPAGTYYDESNDTCVNAKNGTIAINTMFFFNKFSAGETELPPGWSTTAFMSTFPNGTVNGWRVADGFVDCGPTVGSGRYVTALEYTTTDAAGDLRVKFEYAISDAARLRGCQLQFFVNDKMYDYVVAHSEKTRDEVFEETGYMTIPYAEKITLRFMAYIWVFHDQIISQENSDIRVRNVEITGLGSGTSREESCEAGMQNNEQHTRCVPCAAGTSNSAVGEMCSACEEGTFSATSGETMCQSCYPGTTSQAKSGSVRCVTSCIFNSTGHAYNMTGLAGTVIGPVTSVSSNNTFYLSVCDGEMPRGTCNSAAKDKVQMYVCSPGSGADRINFGSELEFVDSADKDTDTTVVLKYHVSARSSDSAVCKGREIVSTVIFRCDPSVGAGFPTLLPSDECAPVFAWTSQYACRVCNESDYEKSVSKCESGSQRTELYLKSTSRCNGAARILVSEDSCTDISLSLGVILGVVGLIIILAAVIVFFVWRNRAITIKYTKLLQSQEGDLEAMADEEAQAERERKEAEEASQISSTTATF